jgi:hypothetical protein
MSGRKEYVKLWLSYEAYFEAYTPEQIGRLVLAMLAYKDTGRQPELLGPERFIWPAIRRDMDEANLAQEAAASMAREHGRLGGRPRKHPLPEDSDTPSENPSGFPETRDIPSGFSETQDIPRTKDNGQGHSHCQGQGQGQPGEGRPVPRRRRGAACRKKNDFALSPPSPQSVRENLEQMERYLSRLQAEAPPPSHPEAAPPAGPD